MSDRKYGGADLMYGSIGVERTKTPRPKPGTEGFGFGKVFTDHMFLLDYEEEAGGWHNPRIVPYGPFELDPASMVFHYGQSVFEGLKAYRWADGSIGLFRPASNAERFNRSCDRMGIPPIDERFFVEAVRELVRIDADWVPHSRSASLYIRPFVIATEAALGVRPAARYRFAVILTPAEGFFGESLKPVDIHVEETFVRAVRGGTGDAKTPGNYASSLKAQELAKRQGCAQVLWLDGVERRYVEEVGAMNVFFVVDGTVVTPSLGGSILAGITRDAVLSLLRSWDIPVEERRIAIDELLAAAAEGRLQEAFGSGTAAVISPIGSLRHDGEAHAIGAEAGPLSRRLYETITAIQYGEAPDPFGWVVQV